MKATYSNNNEIVVNEVKEETVFGENVPITARGIYYFQTEPQPPFLKKI